MQEQYRQVAGWIRDAKKIVVVTGAGLSTAAGIPDFQSSTGYYDAHEDKHYSGPDVLSKWFFQQKPEDFYRYAKEKLFHPEARPTAGHRFLAGLAADKDVIQLTQNIDDLLEQAGAEKVVHLHGRLNRTYCPVCSSMGRTVYLAPDDVLEDRNGILRHVYQLTFTDAEYHIVRPDIVLYGEELDPLVYFEAVRACEEADLLLVAGTALGVYPVADLVKSFTHGVGKHSVYLNLTEPPGDFYFNAVLLGYIDELVLKLEKEKGRLS